MVDLLTTGRAVVLARGLGTRLRADDPDAPLTDQQRRAADAGMKALLPIGGRAFLDYVLSALADAGLRQVALVVAPDHAPLHGYYAAHPPSRVALDYVVQPEALGTANAVAAAEAWTRGEPFLAMNADNLYPVDALRALAALDEPGLPAFDAEDLVRTSNIPAARIHAFALVEVDRDGYLSTIAEKPVPPEGGSYKTNGHRGRGHPHGGSPVPPEGGSYEKEGNPVASGFSRNARVSMNVWRFDQRIFLACREVAPSRRGEYELPEAVALAMARGVKFRAIAARGPVLDLSRRGDAADLTHRLAGVVPAP